MLFRSLVFIFSCLPVFLSVAQTAYPDSRKQKTYNAQRVNIAPKIDGILDDVVWKDIPVATDFLMVEPGDGNPSRETHPTRVKIIYDDEAIYLAVELIDNQPERIIKQFTQRDNIGQSDFFVVDLNTYNDGENQTRFIVTSSGAIADAKMSGENEDFSYNVVWAAEVTHDANGWNAEIKIPYSAIRFPGKEEQVWGLQMVRQISHLNEVYSWNYINKSLGKFTQYTGLLTGIKNIDPPLRLSFYPYTSAEVDNFNGNTQSSFSAGLDIKYGLSDAFTLDATLIPDFGQTAFDNVELNLGPFEQAFGENRAFFTEGTELFTKGNLFYSRRVGDAPIGFNAAQRENLTNEVIIENPERANLLNAIKISGRTVNDLGIGFFNAITQETMAVFLDTISGDSRSRMTEPLANYNIVVLDQQFNQSSSVTLINTNVTRDGHFRDGNVTGLLFDIFNKANSFNFQGEAKMSNVNRTSQNITGFASEIEIERTKGKFRYGIEHELANETYDINDLGLNFINNYNNVGLDFSYQIFEPTSIFNTYRIRLYGNHSRRYKPDIYVNSELGLRFFAVTKERFAFGGSLEVNTDRKDFFEPRRNGSFILYNKNIGGDFFISTDYRKRIAIDARIGHRRFSNSEQQNFSISINPRFRISNKFNLVYNFDYRMLDNRNSFVNILGNDIIFGNRDNTSIENSFRINYNFNTRQALNVSFRNFWSSATFIDGEFATLLNDGKLAPTQYSYTSQNDPNANFNIWNLDLSYSWRFAPGSEAILLYRNSIFNFNSQSELNYIESLEDLLKEPLRQNLSLRVVYFIDYINIKNMLKS